VKDGAKMSKSRGNVVVPDEYIQRWGADTFRMYLMFLGPYQEGGDFRDEGIAGIRRFLDKVWGLVTADGPRTSDDEAERKLHQTIRKVGEDMEGLRYNTAIAAMMEYVNTLRGAGHAAPRAELIEPLVVMLSPLAPHFGEECWERLGHHTGVFHAKWPVFDAAVAAARRVELVVQVNGKVRGRLNVPAGLDEADAVKLARTVEAVARHVDGKPMKKVIYVPDKLLNLVV
jgi:leucyl-tRNA synthetase